MPRRFPLRHPHGETALVYGVGALAAARSELAAWVAGRRLFIVTTPEVWQLHGSGLAALRAAAAASAILEVPAGEAAKRLVIAQELWSAMIAAGGKRDSRLVALGGGSVGDLGGFVAGAFLRGIELAQLPTTLLAQVDAAVGGKTGVDLPEAKNSVGLFHHPRMVVADTEWLVTLPRRELRAGLVEAVKIAFVLSPALFGRLEESLDAVLRGELQALEALVAEAASLKAEVVARDPGESGERKLLNFGHTLGHALEASLGYRGLLHGEAVAYGMRFALRLASRRGLPVDDARRLEEVLGRFPLPPLPELDAEGVWELVQRDKKARERGLGWVLPARLGAARIDSGVPPTEVLAELGAFLAAARGERL